MNRAYVLEVGDQVVTFEDVGRVLQWLREEHPAQACRLTMLDPGAAARRTADASPRRTAA